MHTILQQKRKLRVLKLDGMRAHPDRAFYTFFTSLPFLEELSMDAVTQNDDDDEQGIPQLNNKRRLFQTAPSTMTPDQVITTLQSSNRKLTELLTTIDMVEGIQQRKKEGLGIVEEEEEEEKIQEQEEQGNVCLELSLAAALISSA